MKIYRMIAGVIREIELTPDEMYKAYTEEQRELDRQVWTDDDAQKVFGITMARYLELVGEMEKEMRRLMTKTGCDWEYARDEAITTVSKRATSEGGQ